MYFNLPFQASHNKSFKLFSSFNSPQQKHNQQKYNTTPPKETPSPTSNLKFQTRTNQDEIYINLFENNKKNNFLHFPSGNSNSNPFDEIIREKFFENEEENSNTMFSTE